MAQQTASIRGTVKDEAGGLVAGAKVTAIGAETGVTQETMTNAAGFYNIGNLTVGLYILSVEKDGFSTSVITDIYLNVNDVRETNVSLAVGAVTDEITTEASAIVVETIGGEVAGLITGEQVRELPLNGRNFLQLTLLMPGVSAPDGFNTKNKGLLTGSDLSVSGGATTANMWTVDGAANNDVGSNRTILVYPSLEAIEEFKIHRNSYGAEFGGGGGAQINLVTRGGTNDLSGSAYMFQRRDSWNKKNALLKESGGDQAPLERDDYGYTLGGPIKKDRFHFFVSQEWNDEVRGVVASGLVPTAAQLAGDFNEVYTDCGYQIPVDPLTGQPFPGNVIPGDRISPAGQALLALYPAENNPGNCTNWIDAVDTPIDWAQINGRLDWTVTSKHRALVRYTEDEWTSNGAGGSLNGLWGDDPFPAVDSAWSQPSDSLTAQLNSVIGSSAINSLTYAASGNAIDIGIVDADPTAREAIYTSYPTYFPAGDKSSGGLSHPVHWGAAGISAVWTQGPWYNEQRTDLYKDDYEQVFGDHVVKAGISYSENNKLETPQGSSPEYGTLGGWGPGPGFATGYVGNDWGGNSGNAIADLLLEDMLYGFSELSVSNPVNVKWEDLEVYVADSWKARPNLTLDYGVRWSKYYQPYQDGPALVSSFNPDRFDPALGNAPCNGLMQQPGIDGCGDAGFPEGASFGPNAALVNEDSDNFAPRLGLAWDIKGDGQSVLRAGFGQFFQRDRVSPFLSLPNNAPGALFASGLRTLDGRFVGVTANQGGQPAVGLDIDRENGYLMQYNISWEQAIGRNSSLEVGYVGSRGRHILQVENLNYVPTGDSDGNGQSDRLDFVQCPGGGDGDACRAAYRVYGVYGNGNIQYWTNSGESEYDSLQTQFISRFGRGSQFQTSYTWSDFKSNANVAGADGGITAGTSVTDPENRDLDWGPAGIHREHVFNASLIHNLPTFEGEGGFKEWVLGNWSVGFIYSYSSGQPVLVTTGGFSGLPVAGGGAGYDGAQRPIRVQGVSCSGSGGRQVLNPDAFTLTGYRLGEVSQMAERNACEGPDFSQFDLSLYKNVPIGDRVNVQFRIEIFNLFDETNWVSVDGTWDGTATYDDADAPTVVTGSTPSGNFGVAAAARDAQEIQLGVKITF
jgi:hypothetical protein